jgi:hypothetical protein
MLPLFLLGLFAWMWVAWGERRLTVRLLVLIGASFFGSTFLSPMVMDDLGAVGASDALAYVVRYWEPEGHDRAARFPVLALLDPGGDAVTRCVGPLPPGAGI